MNKSLVLVGLTCPMGEHTGGFFRMVVAVVEVLVSRIREWCRRWMTVAAIVIMARLSLNRFFFSMTREKEFLK